MHLHLPSAADKLRISYANTLTATHVERNISGITEEEMRNISGLRAEYFTPIGRKIL